MNSTKKEKVKQSEPGTTPLSKHSAPEKEANSEEAKDPNGITYEQNRTMMGELVFQRHQLEFKAKTKISKRDTVLEENLVDVRRLLKNSAFSAQGAGNPD